MEDTGIKGNAEIIQALAEGNVLVESSQRRGKSHAYNKKCQDYRIFWQVGPFNFSMDCLRLTVRGALLCPKHIVERRELDKRISDLKKRIEGKGVK